MGWSDDGHGECLGKMIRSHLSHAISLGIIGGESFLNHGERESVCEMVENDSELMIGNMIKVG